MVNWYSKTRWLISCELIWCDNWPRLGALSINFCTMSCNYVTFQALFSLEFWFMTRIQQHIRVSALVLFWRIGPHRRNSHLHIPKRFWISNLKRVKFISGIVLLELIFIILNCKNKNWNDWNSIGESSMGCVLDDLFLIQNQKHQKCFLWCLKGLLWDLRAYQTN